MDKHVQVSIAVQTEAGEVERYEQTIHQTGDRYLYRPDITAPLIRAVADIALKARGKAWD